MFEATELQRKIIFPCKLPAKYTKQKLCLLPGSASHQIFSEYIKDSFWVINEFNN